MRDLMSIILDLTEPPQGSRKTLLTLILWDNVIIHDPNATDSFEEDTDNNTLTLMLLIRPQKKKMVMAMGSRCILDE